MKRKNKVIKCPIVINAPHSDGISKVLQDRHDWAVLAMRFGLNRP